MWATHDKILVNQTAKEFTNVIGTKLFGYLYSQNVAIAAKASYLIGINAGSISTNMRNLYLAIMTYEKVKANLIMHALHSSPVL